MASKMRQWFNLSAEDRCACFVPTYYAHGYKSGLLVPLLLGGSIALPGIENPDDIISWIKQFRPTWFSTGPTHLQAFLDRLQSNELPIEHSLRFILSGASYLPETVRTKLENMLGIPVLDAYGLSETGMTLLIQRPLSFGSRVHLGRWRQMKLRSEAKTDTRSAPERWAK
jgi:acyl-coenzyme A synthetase/AMP-(fatty) acid ligase